MYVDQEAVSTAGRWVGGQVGNGNGAAGMAALAVSTYPAKLLTNSPNTP